MKLKILLMLVFIFSTALAQTSVTIFKTTAEKEYSMPLKVTSDSNVQTVVNIDLPNVFLGTSFAGTQFYGLAPIGATGFAVTITSLTSLSTVEIYKPVDSLINTLSIPAGTSSSVSLTADGGYFKIKSSSPVIAQISAVSGTKNNMRFIPALDGRLVGSQFMFNINSYGRYLSFVSDKDADVSIFKGTVLDTNFHINPYQPVEYDKIDSKNLGDYQVLSSSDIMIFDTKEATTDAITSVPALDTKSFSGKSFLCYGVPDIMSWEDSNNVRIESLEKTCGGTAPCGDLCCSICLFNVPIYGCFNGNMDTNYNLLNYGKVIHSTLSPNWYKITSTGKISVYCNLFDTNKGPAGITAAAGLSSNEFYIRAGCSAHIFSDYGTEVQVFDTNNNLIESISTQGKAGIIRPYLYTSLTSQNSDRILKSIAPVNVLLSCGDKLADNQPYLSTLSTLDSLTRTRTVSSYRSAENSMSCSGKLLSPSLGPFSFDLNSASTYLLSFETASSDTNSFKIIIDSNELVPETYETLCDNGIKKVNVLIPKNLYSDGKININFQAVNGAPAFGNIELQEILTPIKVLDSNSNEIPSYYENGKISFISNLKVGENNFNVIISPYSFYPQKLTKADLTGYADTNLLYSLGVSSASGAQQVSLNAPNEIGYYGLIIKDCSNELCDFKVFPLYVESLEVSDLTAISADWIVKFFGRGEAEDTLCSAQGECLSDYFYPAETRDYKLNILARVINAVGTGINLNAQILSIDTNKIITPSNGWVLWQIPLGKITKAPDTGYKVTINYAGKVSGDTNFVENPALEFSNVYITSNADSNADYNKYLVVNATVKNKLFNAPADNAYVNARIIDSDSNTLYTANQYGKKGLTNSSGIEKDLVFDKLNLERGKYKVCISKDMVEDVFGIRNENEICTPINIWYSLIPFRDAISKQYEISKPINWNYYVIKDSAGNTVQNPAVIVKWSNNGNTLSTSNQMTGSFTIPCGTPVFSKNQLIIDIASNDELFWPSQELLDFDLAAQIQSISAVAKNSVTSAPITDNRIKNYDGSRIIFSTSTSEGFSVKDICGTELASTYTSNNAVNTGAGDNNPSDNYAGDTITAALEITSHATGNKKLEKSFTVYDTIPGGTYLSSNRQSHVNSFALNPDKTNTLALFKDEFVLSFFTPYLKSFSATSQQLLFPTYLLEVYGFNLKASCTTFKLNNEIISMFSESNDRKWNYSYAIIDRTKILSLNTITISSICPNAALKEVSVGKTISNSEAQLASSLTVYDTHSKLIPSSCYNIVPSGCNPLAYSAGTLMLCSFNINSIDTNGCYWYGNAKIDVPVRITGTLKSITANPASDFALRSACSKYGKTYVNLGVIAKDMRDSNIASGTITYSISSLAFSKDSNMNLQYTFDTNAALGAYTWNAVPKLDYYYPTTLTASGTATLMGCFQPFVISLDTNKWYTSGNMINARVSLTDDLGKAITGYPVQMAINAIDTNIIINLVNYQGAYTIPVTAKSGKWRLNFNLLSTPPYYFNSANNNADITVDKLIGAVLLTGTTSSYSLSGNLRYENSQESIRCTNCLNVLVNDVLNTQSYTSIDSNRFSLNINTKLNPGANKFTLKMIPTYTPHNFEGKLDITANIAGILSMTKTRYDTNDYPVSEALPIQYKNGLSMDLENLDFADTFKVENKGDLKLGSPYIVDELLMNDKAVSSSTKNFVFQQTSNIANVEVRFLYDTNLKPGKYTHRVSLYDSNVNGLITQIKGADFNIFSLITNVVFKDTNGVELAKENNVYTTTSGADFIINLNAKKQVSETKYEALSSSALVNIKLDNTDSNDLFTGTMTCTPILDSSGCTIAVPWRTICDKDYNYEITISDAGIQKTVQGTFKSKCNLVIQSVTAHQGNIKTQIKKDEESYIQQSLGSIKLNVSIFEPKLIDSIGALNIMLKDLTTGKIYYSSTSKETCETALNKFNLNCYLDINPLETGCNKFMLDVYVEEDSNKAVNPLSTRFTAEFYIDDIILSASYNNLMMFGTENKIAGNAKFCSGRDSSLINVESKIDVWTQSVTPSSDGNFETSYLADKSGIFTLTIKASDSKSSISKLITDTVSISKTAVSIEPAEKTFDIGSSGEKSFLVRIRNPSTEKQEYELKLVPGGIPARFSENLKTTIKVSVAPEGEYVTYIDVLPVVLGEETHHLQIQNLNFADDKRTCIGTECNAAEKALDFTTITQAIIQKGAFKYAVLDEFGIFEVGLITAFACFILFSKFLK